jgi:hypothetical protein
VDRVHGAPCRARGGGGGRLASPGRHDTRPAGYTKGWGGRRGRAHWQVQALARWQAAQRGEPEEPRPGWGGGQPLGRLGPHAAGPGRAAGCAPQLTLLLLLLLLLLLRRAAAAGDLPAFLEGAVLVERPPAVGQPGQEHHAVLLHQREPAHDALALAGQHGHLLPHKNHLRAGRGGGGRRGAGRALGRAAARGEGGALALLPPGRQPAHMAGAPRCCPAGCRPRQSSRRRRCRPAPPSPHRRPGRWRPGSRLPPGAARLLLAGTPGRRMAGEGTAAGPGRAAGRRAARGGAGAYASRSRGVASEGRRLAEARRPACARDCSPPDAAALLGLAIVVAVAAEPAVRAVVRELRAV